MERGRIELQALRLISLTSRPLELAPRTPPPQMQIKQSAHILDALSRAVLELMCCKTYQSTVIVSKLQSLSIVILAPSVDERYIKIGYNIYI